MEFYQKKGGGNHGQCQCLRVRESRVLKKKGVARWRQNKQLNPGKSNFQEHSFNMKLKEIGSSTPCTPFTNFIRGSVYCCRWGQTLSLLTKDSEARLWPRPDQRSIAFSEKLSLDMCITQLVAWPSLLKAAQLSQPTTWWRHGICSVADNETQKARPLLSLQR